MRFNSTLLVSKLFGIIFLLLTFGGCIGTNSCLPLTSPQLASKVADQTVALVTDFGIYDNEHQPFCSAVWVGHKSILTANHCVEGYAHMLTKVEMIKTLIANGVPAELAQAVVRHGIQDADPEELEVMPLMLQELHALLKTVPEVSPVGLVVPFIVQADYVDIGVAPRNIYYSQAVAMDVGSDLALLTVIKEIVPGHAIASVASTTPVVGSNIVVTGHPIHNAWMFRAGYVSAYRHDMSGEHDEVIANLHGPFLHISLNIAPGDSGGGVFDAAGNLVGIVIFIDQRLVGGYCSHLDNIRGFLAGQHLIALDLSNVADPAL